MPKSWTPRAFNFSSPSLLSFLSTLRSWKDRSLLPREVVISRPRRFVISSKRIGSMTFFIVLNSYYIWFVCRLRLRMQELEELVAIFESESWCIATVCNFMLDHLSTLCCTSFSALSRLLRSWSRYSHLLHNSREPAEVLDRGWCSSFCHNALDLDIYHNRLCEYCVFHAMTEVTCRCRCGLVPARKTSSGGRWALILVISHVL